MASQVYVRELASLGAEDTALVGGKNASLGEMTCALRESGVRVPEGFATTARAYRDFLESNQLLEPIREQLDALGRGERELHDVGRSVRALFEEAAFPDEIAAAITDAYADMANALGRRDPDVAVRSSATAEDLPQASFAGQQETFLNVRGGEALLNACRQCFASLFTDRAIAYRVNNGFTHMEVALSVGVQRMVRSDQAGSGVMFSIDTETGFPHVVLINANHGLGETVVQGMVDPDEYMVFKPLLNEGGYRPIIERRPGSKTWKLVYAETGPDPTALVETSSRERETSVLTDDEILRLSRWAVAIEEHYGTPMDMEWAKDGPEGELFIVQARPETVQARREGTALHRYQLREEGRQLLTGHSIGGAIAAGPVCKLASPRDIEQFTDNAVLVTEKTDPDWVPIMKRAAAIVTDHGGRTSHAAIVSRELGLPAVVGTGVGTQLLEQGQSVTVSCSEGDQGVVYAGSLDFDVESIAVDQIPETRTQIMLNLANPAAAQRWWRLPAQGLGLARMEFIINNHIKVHPMALVRWPAIDDARAVEEIEHLTRSYEDKTAYFVETLARGIGRLAAVFYPRPAILRMSDFKTNEYARLTGGAEFEPHEDNPMLGWRGASRYYDPDYREGFALECRAVRQAREEMGFDNIIVMIPFCRTPEEADKVLAVMAENGLERGEAGLEVYVMCELPSNVMEAQEFAARFDGFSIGSNDLTQLVLGIDRDSDRLAPLFDERRPAVIRTIRQLVPVARAANRKTGLCGQAPSDYPEFARQLVEAGLDSISVNPDSFVPVKTNVAAAESRCSD